jgi:dephospho-CoA kinase
MHMIVGLTGGIGSGKSEVSSRFKKLGIDVIDADVVARQVVEIGRPALNDIAEHFGQAILNSDKSLNRQQLREIIFNSPAEKTWLENLLHPIIREEIIHQLKKANSHYAILSSPLLLETNQNELVDRVLVVDTREVLQLERASKRDKSKIGEIEKIIATQISRSDRCAKADDIISNHGDLNELDIEVRKLHQYYLELAKKSNQ